MEETFVKFYGWDQALMKPAAEGYDRISDPRDLYEILRRLWSADTCAPRMRKEWKEKDPSYGQCSITSFLVQDIFGGIVKGIPLPDGSVHCFNVIGDASFDLTSGQFLPEVLDYTKAELQERETHFRKKEKYQRYLTLKQKLQDYLDHLNGCRILVTNDDGIGSEGLRRLVEAAKLFGEVWLVAPDGQRSAASHSISIHDPFDIYPYGYPVPGVHAYSCSGTPADCIRAGIRYLMPEKPDLIFTGINNGYNLATDIQYSATAGAAFEGAFQGVRSIAVSETPGGDREISAFWLVPVLRRLAEAELGQDEIFNVNFPGGPKEECRGLLFDRKTSRHVIYDDHYVALEQLENGGVRIIADGVLDNLAEEGSDLKAVREGYISVGRVHNIG